MRMPTWTDAFKWSFDCILYVKQFRAEWICKVEGLE